VRIPTVAYPGKLSQTPTDYRHKPPHVGEHTREILKDWLASEDEELDALAAQGAIVQRD
jgi:crotonobetainyl-CoA:carnitine CoA-transferase CaiB-like acyl-CoA transferase